MKYVLKQITVVTCILCGWACSPRGGDKQGQPVTATVEVASIVCGSCAKAIEKAVTQVNGVQDAKVDVDKKTATVKYFPAKTNVDAIEMSIVNAGYDANGKKRNPQAYENLDECCRIDG